VFFVGGVFLGGVKKACGAWRGGGGGGGDGGGEDIKQEDP